MIDYYNRFDEDNRLADHWGQIEFLRTQSILSDDLPKPPAVILDVGGASGRYSLWLARKGYQVHLVDPVPKHIQQARKASAKQPDFPLASCTVGHARSLKFTDAFFDGILFMGPMYHLLKREARLRALGEVYRVLKDEGVVFVAAISRFASTVDGLCSGFFDDPQFREIMEQDLKTGQHRNPSRHPAYFTDAFFHHPDELAEEIRKAGFRLKSLKSIESLGYLMKDFEKHWDDKIHRNFLMHILKRLEEEPCLTGASPHIMGVAVKSINGRNPS